MIKNKIKILLLGLILSFTSMFSVFADEENSIIGKSYIILKENEQSVYYPGIITMRIVFTEDLLSIIITSGDEEYSTTVDEKISYDKENQIITEYSYDDSIGKQYISFDGLLVIMKTEDGKHVYVMVQEENLEAYLNSIKY